MSDEKKQGTNFEALQESAALLAALTARAQAVKMFERSRRCRKVPAGKRRAINRRVSAAAKEARRLNRQQKRRSR